MKILLTGANGFVGAWLSREMIQAGYELMATGSGVCRLPFSDHPHFQYREMELKDGMAIEAVCSEFQPDLIVHSGAMSRPDACELNRELAFAVNVTATNFLLKQARIFKSRFIFLSSDFVFDGKNDPYGEADIPSPVNYYGQTKYEAEKLVMDHSDGWAIVRTILVYGKPIIPRSYLLNIVEDKLKKREEYRLVNDQFRTPTYVGDLVAGIMEIIQRKAAGIFHLSGEEKMTPYEMGIEMARMLGLDTGLLIPVTAQTFKEPAQRPASTSFLLEKAKGELGYQPHSFSEALKATLF